MPSVETMRRLTKLSEFGIHDSWLLIKRCTKGSAPEWEKISHIATIKFNGRVIGKLFIQFLHSFIVAHIYIYISVIHKQ